MNDRNRRSTTTDAGTPVASDEFSLTVGTDGPILLQDHYLIEQMATLIGSALPNVSRTPRAVALSDALK